jgi:hypothetical protein
VFSFLAILTSVVAQSAESDDACGKGCIAQLTERGTGEAIAGITLRIGEQALESDALGRVFFDDQGQKELKVTILQPGWKIRTSVLSTALGAERILWLESEAQEALGTYQQSPFHPHRINQEQVESIPGTLQDPLRTLQNLPGTARAPMNSGWLLVRGVNPEDSRFFWAGLPLAQLVHLGGFASVFHPETVGSVEFQATGWVDRQAGLGGQVEIESVENTKDLRLELGADLINTTAFVSGPLNPEWSGSASFRNSWLRGAMSLTQGKEAARIAPSFRDWSLGLQGKNSVLLYLGFVDGIDAPTVDGEQILQVGQSVHQVLGRQIWRQGTSKAQISGQISSAEHSLSRESQSLSVHKSQQARTHVEFQQQYGSLRTLFGGDLGAGTHRIQLSPQQVQRFWGSAEGFGSVQLGSTRVLEMGLRNTHLSLEKQLTRFGLNPAIRVKWPLFAWVQNQVFFQSQISRRHQAPSLAVLVGDPEGQSAPLERADELSGGLFFHGQFDDGALLQLSIDSFFKSLSDLANREEDGTLGSFTGEAKGIETFLQWETDHLAMGLSAGFSQSTRQEDSGHEPKPHALDPGIQLALVATWKAPAGWIFSSRFRYASGVPFQSDRPTAYDLFTQQEILLAPTVNESTGRLPDPHSLDIKISKGRTYKHWRLEAYLDLQNIYNRRAPEPILTGFEEKPVFGFGMPFLPVFGIEGSFWP